METLTYQTAPIVTLGTNRFVNVPIILQFDDTPLISIAKNESLRYTTEIPIYNADGTYLAKINGTRIYATEAGKKAGLVMQHPAHMTVCKMGGKTLFEIRHGTGDAFRMEAELFTPSGFFVKYLDAPTPVLMNDKGEALRVGGVTMSGNIFANLRIGIWVKSDGSVALGVS